MSSRLSTDDRRRARAIQDAQRLQKATEKAEALGRVSEAAEAFRDAKRRLNEALAAAHDRGASFSGIANKADLDGMSKSSLAAKLETLKGQAVPGRQPHPDDLQRAGGSAATKS
jgi:hypothetical protein